MSRRRSAGKKIQGDIEKYMAIIEEECSNSKDDKILASLGGIFNGTPFGIKEIAERTKNNKEFSSFLKITSGSKEGQHYLSVIHKKKDTHVEKRKRLEATIKGLFLQINVTKSKVKDLTEELGKEGARLEELKGSSAQIRKGLQSVIIKQFREIMKLRQEKQEQQQQQQILIDYINKHLSIRGKHTNVVKPIGSEIKAIQSSSHF